MKTYKYIFAIVLSVICFSSCDDFLDKAPLNLPSTDTFLEDEEQIKMAVAGAHNPLYLQFIGIPFVIYMDNGSDIAAERDATPENMYCNPNSIQVVWTWEHCYRGISRCNFIIDNIDRAKENVSQEKIDRYKAEMRVLRSYYYLVLTDMYGDVPLIEHNVSLQDSYVARTSKDKVVDFIMKECKEAIPSLDEKNQPNTMAITKGLAYAIMARTALYNERWQEAIDNCQAVMGMEGKEYELNPDYASITKLAGKTSKEIIWAIQYNQDDITHTTPKCFISRMGGGYSNKMPVQALVDSYECTDGLSIDKSPLYDPKQPWKNRDPRLGYTIALPGTVFMGYQFETNKDSTKCWNYNVTPAVRVDNLDATHTYASFSGYCWRKYVDEGELRSDGASSINAIVFRYAEILLTYAEAKIELNKIDQSVYDAINKVRKRAGMPNIKPNETQQELRCAVRKERKYEFAGEGLRLSDIRRWKMANKVLNGICYGRVPTGYPSKAPHIDEYGNPDYSTFSEKDKFGTKLGMRVFDASKHYLSPLPYVEIQANKNLKQNPGY